MIQNCSFPFSFYERKGREGRSIRIQGGIRWRKEKEKKYIH